MPRQDKRARRNEDAFLSYGISLGFQPLPACMYNAFFVIDKHSLGVFILAATCFLSCASRDSSFFRFFPVATLFWFHPFPLFCAPFWMSKQSSTQQQTCKRNIGKKTYQSTHCFGWAASGKALLLFSLLFYLPLGSKKRGLRGRGGGVLYGVNREENTQRDEKRNAER